MHSGRVWWVLGCVSCGGVIADLASPPEGGDAGESVPAGENGPACPSGTLRTDLTDADALWFMHMDSLSDLGGAVAAGDVDGDGVVDLILGAAEEPFHTTRDGTVFVVHGPLSDPTSAAHALHVAGGQFLGFFGHAVAAVDLDGDGRDEVAVGEPWAFRDDDVAHYHSGRVSLLDEASMRAGVVVARTEAQQDYRYLGTDLVRIADASGRAHLVATAPGARASGVVAGLGTGALNVYGASLREESVWSPEAGIGCVDRLAVLGDVDGDGADDLAVDGACGVWVLSGAPLIAGTDPVVTQIHAAEGGVADGTRAYAVGDQDGDGLSDVLVTTPASGPPTGGQGVVALAGDTGLPKTPGPTSHLFTRLAAVGASVDLASGVDVVGLPPIVRRPVDLDGDGQLDLVVLDVDRVSWMRGPVVAAQTPTPLVASSMHMQDGLVDDVTGDRRPDLVLGWEGYVRVWELCPTPR